MADPCKQCGTRYLVAIEMQNWQHRAIMDWIKELVRVPGRCKRPGFSFAVAYDARHYHIRIVESRSKGVRKRIAQLPAFVNRAGRLRSGMTGNATRKGKLLGQPLHTSLVPRNMRIAFAITPLQPGICNQRRASMARARYVNHIQIVFFDNAVQMHVNKIETRSSAPMPE